MRQVNSVETKGPGAEEGVWFQNGTAQYFGVNPGGIWIDFSGKESEASCCGVNLAVYGFGVGFCWGGSDFGVGGSEVGGGASELGLDFW
jgi:hypothetical protein